jgi:hypothetical protein
MTLLWFEMNEKRRSGLSAKIHRGDTRRSGDRTSPILFRQYSETPMAAANPAKDQIFMRRCSHFVRLPPLDFRQWNSSYYGPCLWYYSTVSSTTPWMADEYPEVSWISGVAVWP